MIYVSDTLGPSFLKALVEKDGIEIGKKSNNIKETLDNLDEGYVLNISNKAILGTLKNLGINVGNNESKKIYPIPGDTIYLIQPSESCVKYKNDLKLPESVRLTLDQLKIKNFK